MEQVISIDILNKDDLFEKFDKKKISRELVEYIITAGLTFRKTDDIKIVINSKVRSVDISNLLIQGMEDAYKRCIFKYNISNFNQVIYFVLGILLLFLSTIIYETVFKEVVLIGGWVFIWGTLETEMFSDVNSIKRKKMLKKLLNSEIVVEEL